jgi:quinol monooxygenase YgiN
MRRRWPTARSRSSVLLVVLGSGILVVLLVLSIVRFAMSSSNAEGSFGVTTNLDRGNVAPPFSLLVTLTFTESTCKEQFILDITPLCEYIRQYESNTTLSYEVLRSDSNPLQVLVLERYEDKETAYLQIHKSSPPFLQFRAQLQEMQQKGHVTIQGASYYDAGIGFVRH